MDLEFIRSEFEKEGYELLSTNYRWCNKLDYICPNGHKWHILWHKWTHGRRCPFCYGNKKLSIEYIKSEFERFGYKLLTKEYKNSRTKLDYVCPKGHSHSIRWNHWKSAFARCPTCRIIDMHGENNYNWKGGVSFEVYCEVWRDKEYKRSILKRDGYRCKNPNCTRNSKKLVIHHIDYNKKNCHPNNLITLCNSCNIKANSNREHWKQFYASFPGTARRKGKGV